MVELVWLFPHEAPEILSNPINMAAAVRECSHPVNPCHLSCSIEYCAAINPYGNISAVMPCHFTLGFGRLSECKRQKRFYSFGLEGIFN